MMKSLMFIGTTGVVMSDSRTQGGEEESGYWYIAVKVCKFAMHVSEKSHYCYFLPWCFMIIMSIKNISTYFSVYMYVKRCLPSNSVTIYISVDDRSGPAEKEIFLSYGHTEDVDLFVLQLQKDLEACGFSVWLDKTDIPPGSNWRRAIGVQVHYY